MDVQRINEYLSEDTYIENPFFQTEVLRVAYCT